MEILGTGDLQEAFASMVSDCNAHPETKDHPGAQLGMMMMMGGHLSTGSEMRRFIEGFN